MYHPPICLLPAQVSPLIDKVNGDGRVVLIVVAIGALVMISAFVVTLIDKIHRRNAETSLKREMIERGLSPDEMERVLSVKPTNSK
jgi:hypothetical protein